MKTTQIHTTISWLVVVGFLLFAGNFAGAAEIFFDDFSDGSVTNDIPVASDGTPVKWTPRADLPGDYDASSGDYVFTATENRYYMTAMALDFTLYDTSIRAQGKVSSVGGSLIVRARQQSVQQTQSYFGGIGYFPDEGGTIGFAGRETSGSDTVFFGGMDFPVLPFDIREEDGIVQLDVIGNEVKFWAWRLGDPMPDVPLISEQDSFYEAGHIRISNGGANDGNITVFRSVRLADTHIPEPSTIVLVGVLCLAMLSSAGRRSSRHS